MHTTTGIAAQEHTFTLPPLISLTRASPLFFSLPSLQTLVLASITSLKKLCNHPSLIIDHEQGGKVAEGFEECVDLLPPSAIASRRRR